MIAFAANSIFCRMALGVDQIDAASFTLIRIASGAVLLMFVLALRRDRGTPQRTDWRMVAGLFVYMVFFSFAYISLPAGTGALILFGAVQITMFAFALKSGERFSALSIAGLALAILGLIYLVSPGILAPDPLGAGLMAVAGIAWGAYSILGAGTSNPLGATARNFVFSVPPAVLVVVVLWSGISLSTPGVLLAILSGAIASGCGYVIWYAALPRLSAGHAATVQLSVPIIAAIGGVALLSEAVTLRLILASIATLGGVAIVLGQRSRRA